MGLAERGATDKSNNAWRAITAGLADRLRSIEQLSAGFVTSMAEERLKKKAIEGMVAAVEHIRDCERCRRLWFYL